MAATPKIVRITAKKVRREVSNYFGFPIRAKVKFGEEDFSQTHKKGNKTKGIISIDKRMKGERLPLDKLRTFLRHEMFHIAGDSYTLKHASSTFSATNEAIAILSNAESKMKKSKNPYAREEYLRTLEQRIMYDPPKDQTHLAGAIIVFNIIKKFPDAKARQAHVKHLLKQNSDALLLLREGKAQFLGVNEIGEIQTRPI
jgi:hypothetical protein